MVTKLILLDGMVLKNMELGRDKDDENAASDSMANKDKLKVILRHFLLRIVVLQDMKN